MFCEAMTANISSCLAVALLIVISYSFFHSISLITALGQDTEEATRDWALTNNKGCISLQLNTCTPGNENNKTQIQKIARVKAYFYKKMHVFKDLCPVLALLSNQVCTDKPI